VCRSIFAEAIFSHLIQDQDLQDSIECTSKASKDYNVGEAPDARAVEVAQELGLQLREGAVARVFDCTSDIVLFDLLLVMDKVSQACFSLSLFILLLLFASTSLLLLSE
jgi:protein-tyrosine phosphatase